MTEKINPWKYVKRIDPDSLKNNRFVNPRLPPQTPPADDAGEGEAGGSGDDGGKDPDTKIIDAKDFLVLENLVCYGSDGNVFEQHDKIGVAKDVARKSDGDFVSFKPYDAILHFEKAGSGLFLPSYALQCAVLVSLYKNRSDPEVEKVLMQYKDYDPGYGWHNNNTIVDGKGGRIIHYPSKDDFPSHGGTADINTGRRIERPFPVKMNRDNSNLEDALKNAVKAKYTKDLTGLRDPRILIDIAKYFGKTVWYNPADNSVCSAWLGCDGGGGDFGISSGGNLSGGSTARGVRR